MKENNFLKKAVHNEHFSLIVTFCVVFILMSLLNGGKFLAWQNVSTMMYQLPMIGLLAVGMMVSELTGGINLSLVANANFNSIVLYMLLVRFTGGATETAGIGIIFLVLCIVFIICSLIGLFNGLLITKLNIPPLLVTLGSMTLLQGLSLLLTKGYTVSGFPATLTFLGNGNVLGIPMSLIVFIIVMVIAHIVLDRTVYGKQLYITGANKTAAKYSNINVDRVIIIQYIISALFSFFAALIMIGQMNSAKANYYESYLLIAVLASFLGGVNPNGGFGKIVGTILASVILQLISTGLNLMRFDPFLVTATWGIIIIVLLFGREFFGKIKSRYAKLNGRS